VVELVDTLDSKSGFFGSSGSSPLTGTTLQFQDVLKRSKTPVLKGLEPKIPV
jgi:hypothetical protein